MRIVYVAYFGSNTNVIALRWYLDKVHSLVKTKVPDYKLSIIGRGDLSIFHKQIDSSVDLIGEVHSIAPYIECARVGIVPALSGSGFRGKVNQYAILGVPSVISSIALRGLAYTDGTSIFVADSPELFAERCVQLLLNSALNAAIAKAARDVCIEKYTWSSKMGTISEIYNLNGKQ